MFPIANQAFEYVTPPRAFGPTGPVGQVVAVSTSTVPQLINLQLLQFGIPYSATSGTQAVNGVVSGDYITIYADGADIGVIFGSTAASVSGSTGQPNLKTVGSLSGSGTYQGATGTCWRIPAGGVGLRVFPQLTQDLFMGFVGASGTSGATGTMRMYQSSPAYMTR